MVSVLCKLFYNHRLAERVALKSKRVQEKGFSPKCDMSNYRTLFMPIRVNRNLVTTSHLPSPLLHYNPLPTETMAPALAQSDSPHFHPKCDILCRIIALYSCPSRSTEIWSLLLTYHPLCCIIIHCKQKQWHQL